MRPGWMMECAFVGVSWRLARVLEIEVVAIRGFAGSLEAGMHAKHTSRWRQVNISTFTYGIGFPMVSTSAYYTHALNTLLVYL